MARQVVLDTETTGLDYRTGHRVIEIGCVEMVNRKLTGQRFHRYLNPQREVEAGALAVHGITEEFLQDKPLFVDVADEFYAFIGGAELVVHNAPFDIGFLDHELSLVKKGFTNIADYCTIFDTLALARKKHPGQRNSLDALCKRYDVTHFDRQLHGALLDAEILAQVYLLMTGGQSSLFGDLEQAPLQKKAKVQKNATARPSLLVIRADEQELAAHNEFLAWLGEEAGHE